MPLPTKPTESSSNSIDKGVYLSKGTILSVKDLSNHPKYKRPADQVVKVKRKDKSGNYNEVPVDICVEITYQTDGGDEKSFRLFGDYLKDAIDPTLIKNWKGTGNQVANFLFAVLQEEDIAKSIRDDWSIDDTVLESVLKGKIFQEVRYCSGTYEKDGQVKMSTKSWKYFGADVDEETITEGWIKVKISDKYIKGQYRPDVVDFLASSKGEDTAFNFGANVDVDPI